MTWPAFKVWCDDETEDCARSITAFDAGDAATDWAEQTDSDSGEHRIANDHPEIVNVRAEDGTVTRWKVRGELEPTYWAEQQETP